MLPLPEKYIFHFLEPNQFELPRKKAIELFSREDIEKNAIPVWDQKDFPNESEDSDSDNLIPEKDKIDEEISSLRLHDVMMASKYGAKINPNLRNDPFDKYLVNLSKYLNKYFKSARFVPPSDLMKDMIIDVIQMRPDDDQNHKILRKIALFIWNEIHRRFGG